jgi:hypothetical protein
MDQLVIAGRSFTSRLIVGTGKYKDGAETKAAIEASGAEMVTVAVRRVELDRSKESLLDFIDPAKYFLLPNTAGCYTPASAARLAFPTGSRSRSSATPQPSIPMFKRRLKPPASSSRKVSRSCPIRQTTLSLPNV